MRFQSKFRKHKLLVKTTRRYIQPGAISPTIEPGIIAEFEGPQRIFDSVKAAEVHGWDEDTRNMVEDFLLKHKTYGNGIYLAPGQELPKEKQSVARVKPKAQRRICAAIGINEDGTIDQCPNEPSVGKKYCFEHDPDEAKVVRGGATTVD